VGAAEGDAVGDAEGMWVGAVGYGVGYGVGVGVGVVGIAVGACVGVADGAGVGLYVGVVGAEVGAALGWAVGKEGAIATTATSVDTPYTTAPVEEAPCTPAAPTATFNAQAMTVGAAPPQVPATPSCIQLVQPVLPSESDAADRSGLVYATRQSG
jgi:hypothetical protein